MKSEEIYDAWKDQRNQIEVGHDFAEKVMKQVSQYEQKKGKPLFDLQRLVELISAHPLAKTGLVAMGAIAGFARLIFMIVAILSKGVING